MSDLRNELGGVIRRRHRCCRLCDHVVKDDARARLMLSKRRKGEKREGRIAVAFARKKMAMVRSRELHYKSDPTRSILGQAQALSPSAGGSSSRDGAA